MISSVTADNIARHADPRSIRAYTREEGLWPIEEALIADFMPRPPARILDLGCGAGRTTIGLARAGYDPIAIDLSEALLAAARGRHPELAFERMDATALGFTAATFDGALFSFNGIDYVYPTVARVRCMNELFRVLKPGGIFIFSSHNAIGHFFSGGFLYVRGHWNAAQILIKQWRNPYLRDWYFRYEDFGGDQHFFSAPPHQTVAQLHAAGFEVLDVRGTSGERRPARIRFRQAHVHFVARRPLA